MSLRLRGALVGLLTAGAAFVALPGSALAAGETITVTPSSTQAGGNPSITAALTFATGDTPKTVVTSLAPGLLSNLNANLACLGSVQTTAACQVGTATAHTNLGNETGNLYLVPGQNGDAAGIQFVATSPLPVNQYIGVSLNKSAPGGLNLTTTFPNLTPVQITGFTATFNPTLNGQPFTRLPTSCGAATSTMNVTYYGATAAGTASGSFTPTGCSSLPYAPTQAATATKDKSDQGVEFKTTITQAANEAATKSIVLGLPNNLTPNVTADAACLNATGCTVGTATATSPLVPNVALQNGTVKLSAPTSATTPQITISFPAPFAVSISGIVNLGNNSVTFSNVPDIPLTSLVLDVTGPNGQKAFNLTSCSPATLTTDFTAHSGATKTVATKVKLNNCALKSKPTASGSTSGLSKGHPKLKFKVTHGKGAPKLASVSIGLPGGLKFSRSAFVSHRSCTTKNHKKKCTTTTLIKGLGIKGAKAKSVKLKSGRLVIALRKAANSVTVSTGGPLVSETKGLRTKVKKHKTKKLTFTLKVTDAKHANTSIPLKLAAH